VYRRDGAAERAGRIVHIRLPARDAPETVRALDPRLLMLETDGASIAEGEALLAGQGSEDGAGDGALRVRRRSPGRAPGPWVKTERLHPKFDVSVPEKIVRNTAHTPSLKELP
jgi:hypothetical protein